MKVTLNGYFYKEEKESIKTAIDAFNSFFNISDIFYFNMNSISKNEISNLNLEYFNKNVATDVLSFPLFSGIDAINQLNQGYPENLGDMFFCRPILKRNASEYNKVLIEELQLVLIHGLLHLVGYSHKNEKELRKKEDAILDKVWNGFITD